MTTNLKQKYFLKLSLEWDSVFLSNSPDKRRLLREAFDRLVDEVELSAKDMNHLFDAVADELLGYGPLTSVLADNDISEIFVADPQHVFAIRQGRLEECAVRFDDANHVLRILDRIRLEVEGLRHGQSDIPLAGTLELPNGVRLDYLLRSSDGTPVVVIRKMSR